MFKGSANSEAAENAPTALRRLNKPSPSLIGTDLVIVGTLTSTGDIQIDGRVDGDIRAGRLTVGEMASYEGDVVADEVAVHGRVSGSIRARSVSLASTSHVEGKIIHESLAVDVGAFFEGDCRHSPSPLADSVGTPPLMRPVIEVPREIGATSSPISDAMQKPATKLPRGALIGVMKAAP